MPRTLMIEINNQTRTSVDEEALVRAATLVLKGEKKSKKGLSIALVGEKRSRELNRVYRNKDKVADVLSFEESEIGLGEVILTPAKIRKDAIKYGITHKRHLIRLLVHGILHLLSYDHEGSKEESTRMEKKERHYLGLLAIPFKEP